MTRPPFAEFSALAVRELTVWIGGSALWSERLSDVLSEHFLPVAEQAGLDPEEAWEALGEFTGPVYGAALEDLCTRLYEDPPQNLVADFLKKRGFRLPLLAKSYLEAMRDSAPGVYEVVSPWKTPWRRTGTRQPHPGVRCPSGWSARSRSAFWILITAIGWMRKYPRSMASHRARRHATSKDASDWSRS